MDRWMCCLGRSVSRFWRQWNATQAEYPSHRCIHELFEEQVERTPSCDRGSVRRSDAELCELNAQANRLARHLREHGVGPDSRVGICVERGPQMVIGLLAILKAGGAYVPLDPSYPGAAPEVPAERQRPGAAACG